MTAAPDPAALLAALRAAGFSLRTAGGKVFVSPASALSADQRAAVAACRAGLAALLQEGADGGAGASRPPVEVDDATRAYAARVLAAWDDLPAAAEYLAAWGRLGETDRRLRR
jgi:hypothetical protein